MIGPLDPDPDNQLGKGIFSHDFEADLLAQDYVFAVRFPPRKGKPFGTLLCSKRPIADAVTDGELDSPRFRSQPRLISGGYAPRANATTT